MPHYRSKCYVYYGPGQVKTEEREIVCGATDIILKIDVCGRCGTDRRLFVQPHPRVKTPTVLGHELVGRVVEVGKDVATLTKGMGYREGHTLSQDELMPPVGSRVTVQGRTARHWNGLMLMRDPIQNLTFYIPGAYAQYMKVPEEMIRSGAIIPVLDNISDEEAALAEPAACALESIFATPHAVGVDAMGRHIFRSGIKPEGRTLIIGSGTLAMILARLARIEGAAEVWLIVRSEEKASLIAGVLGNQARFHIVPNYADLPLPQKLAREAEVAHELAGLTDGFLFDDVILACASLDAQRFMFELLNPDGYGVASCFAGLHVPSEGANVDLLHYRIGKAFGMSGCSTRTMTTVIQWLAQGKLSLSGFTSPQRFSLDDNPAEFLQTKADGRKPMLYPWD